MNDRPKVWLNFERDAHRFDRQHDVGKQHGPIDAELLDWHERDLFAKLGGLGQGQDGILLAQRAVSGQAAARLAHEPHGRRVGGLTAAGGQHALGAGHGAAGDGHPSSPRISSMLPATQVKIGVSRSV